MTQTIPRSKSRKVNGYVKAVLALEAVRRKREERYDRFVRPLDRKRDVLAAEVDRRMRALIGTQQAEARRILGAMNGTTPCGCRTQRRRRRDRRATGGHVPVPLRCRDQHLATGCGPR